MRSENSHLLSAWCALLHSPLTATLPMPIVMASKFQALIQRVAQAGAGARVKRSMRLRSRRCMTIWSWQPNIDLTMTSPALLWAPLRATGLSTTSVLRFGRTPHAPTRSLSGGKVPPVREQVLEVCTIHQRLHRNIHHVPGGQARFVPTPGTAWPGAGPCRSWAVYELARAVPKSRTAANPGWRSRSGMAK